MPDDLAKLPESTPDLDEGRSVTQEPVPLGWETIVLEWIAPKTAEEAHKLAANAKNLRALGESKHRPGLVEIAAQQEQAAALFLMYDADTSPIAGAGRELIPVTATDDAKFADTVSHPNRTTARASAERLALASASQSLDLAIDMAETVEARDSMERGLAHQMAVAHRLCMRLGERVNRELDRLDRTPLDQGTMVEITRLVNSQTRLGEMYQRGMLTIAKSRTGNVQRVNVTHQHVQVNSAGGNVAVAGQIESKSRGRRDGGVE